MSDRRGAVLQVAKEAYRKKAHTGSRAKLVDVDDFEFLQEELARYGPEPVGFVFELADSGLEAVPDEWAVASRWWLEPGVPELDLDIRPEDVTGEPDLRLNRRPTSWEARLVVPTVTGEWVLIRYGDTIPEALRALALAVERVEVLHG